MSKHGAKLSETGNKAAPFRLPLRVTPRASRDELQRAADGAFVLRLKAPPVEGAANAACCAFLAEFFGVSKSRVSVVFGDKSRNKILEIEGITAEAAQKILADVA